MGEHFPYGISRYAQKEVSILPAPAKLKPFLLVLAIGFVADFADAAAGEGANLYLTPSLGYTWYKFQSFEIEERLVAITAEDEAQDWEEADEDDILQDEIHRPVGRQTFYTGSGLDYGISAGAKIFALGLGAHYSFAPIAFEGYSKKYRFDKDELMATGHRFYDSMVNSVHKVLLEIAYGLPIWRIQLDFRTRLGAVIIENKSLVMGRSIENNSGFMADVGGRLGLSPAGFVSIGIEAWYGFYSFASTYHGSYGTALGVGGILAFFI